MSEFLDAEMMESLCEDLKKHLEQCEHCRIEVNTLERTIQLFKKMPCDQVPGGVHERLFTTLRFDKIGSSEEEK
jgi:anti-sigma factor RsiW